MHINETYNYDDNFVRMATIALCKVFGTKIRWINRYSTGKKIRVLLPFFTSYAGQERFMLDAFVDDTASTRVELNTDQKQRGIITFKGGSQRDDEFANPNQYLAKETKINNEFKSIVSRVRAVPISLNYDIQIRLDNEWEVDTCYTKVMDVLHNYRFFYISYFGLKIDAFFKLPTDTGIEIPREINISSENIITMKFTLEVVTYYPAFTVSTDDYEICDNDDQIDWNFIGINKPDGSDIPNSLGSLKRVYWYNNLVDNKSKEVLIKEKEELRDNEINNME
ncbi:hypothetical protein M0Q97_02735 [Candidatus Dojkabacteria bacterium]|jgi:hypothetical protein|nr:hypothetical protein [Candidatus Dojkabacteria bacterium]